MPKKESFEVKVGLAEMLMVGVLMDVIQDPSEWPVLPPKRGLLLPF